MFIIEKENNFPIKIWLENEKDVDEIARKQAENLSTLPFLHKWVALMADTHAGMGMPIGGVIATKDVIIPNAVGVDIGCGMCFVSTDLHAEVLRKTKTQNGNLVQGIVGGIQRNIPLGFKSHKEKQDCKTMDIAKGNIHLYEKNTELLKNIDKAYYQVGTLGGGNHFIELQEDENGFICIMIHSGSRNFGKQVCDYFNTVAEIKNKKWYSSVPIENQLAFLPVLSDDGKQYINWMKLALDFAKENRAAMMSVVKQILDSFVTKHTDYIINFGEEINSHHNYANLENHYGENVWVHRKGAIRANDGEKVIIPGAMGSYSYIAMGLGNKESFNTTSHGAGRVYSRTKARNKFNTQEVMEDLKRQNVTIGTPNKRNIGEESRFAYKDINVVMENQKDLAVPIKTLKTVGVVKG